MIRRRPVTLLASGAVAALLAVAANGCGGGDSSGASAATQPTTTAPDKPNAPEKPNAPASSATVVVAQTSLGQILQDAQGRTLYLFKKDTGTTSECNGACAAAWPPLQANQPTAGSGADAAKLGATTRSDGSKQVTYNGHPLYLFTGDQNAGDTNGEGLNAFGATWFVVSPAGNEVTNSSSNTNGGGGY
jgi:predicted lipoprotein with Yx(FWY)xxD motif